MPGCLYLGYLRNSARCALVERLEARRLLSAVVGRFVFYNDSAWNSSTGGDDAAIAIDNSALLPGQTATIANDTSCSKRINDLMVEIPGLPINTSATFDDFTFKVRKRNDPSSFSAAPAPA